MEAAPGTPECDRLDVLATLVMAYEQEHYPIGPPDPIGALEYYIESRRLQPDDLQLYIGSQAQIANVLKRRRPLTFDMIRRLHTGLGISANMFIQPCEPERKTA